MVSKFCLLAVVALVAGCASPQDRAATVVSRFGPYCEGLGYTKGTDPWRSCLTSEQARMTAIALSN
jgi:hypothetical protein